MNIMALLIRLLPTAKTVLIDNIRIGSYVKKYKLISFLTLVMLFASFTAYHYLFRGIAYGVLSINQHKQLTHKELVIDRLRRDNARLALKNEVLRREAKVEVNNNNSDASMNSGDK